MKKLFSLMLMLMAVTVQAQQKPLVLDLWPDGAPTDNGLSGEEKEVFPTFIANISHPTLTVYQPSKPNGICVVCCPGGGYFGLSMANEGTDYAQWFLSQGITFCVLKYRMPNGHPEIILEDGGRALSLVREHAQEWGVDPTKVGIMGHSAGGHFAAANSTLFKSSETRPDFSILLYPVTMMDDATTHAGTKENLLGKNPDQALADHYSLEKQVTENTPPAIVIVAMDDKTVPVPNSVRYFHGLMSHGVKNCSLHIYPTGDHGFGFGDQNPFKRQWTEEVEKWLRWLWND